MSDERGTAHLAVEMFEVEDLGAFRERVDTALRANAWDQLDDEHRKALALLMRDLCLRMLESPGEWIPKGLIAGSKTDMAIVIHVGCKHIEERVIAMRMEAERRQVQRRLDLLALREELSNGPG